VVVQVVHRVAVAEAQLVQLILQDQLQPAKAVKAHTDAQVVLITAVVVEAPELTVAQLVLAGTEMAATD
jgi:hypothetical protein